MKTCPETGRRRGTVHCIAIFMNLTSDSDVDGVAAVSVFGFTPVHSSIGQFDSLQFAGWAGLAAPARPTLRQKWFRTGNTSLQFINNLHMWKEFNCVDVKHGIDFSLNVKRVTTRPHCSTLALCLFSRFLWNFASHLLHCHILESHTEQPDDSRKIWIGIKPRSCFLHIKGLYLKFPAQSPWN